MLKLFARSMSVFFFFQAEDCIRDGHVTGVQTCALPIWTLYIDTNNKAHSHPSLQEFEKKYGTKIDYTEDINDNASFFGKIQGPLSRGQSINRDIIVLTDNDRYLSLMI